MTHSPDAALGFLRVFRGEARILLLQVRNLGLKAEILRLRFFLSLLLFRKFLLGRNRE